MESKQKRRCGESYIILIQIFVLKVMNNERKTLTRHEMIALQNKLCWWLLVCVKNQWVHPKLRRSSVSFTYLFKFTYFCFVDVWTLKKEFCLRNKKPCTAIKTTTIHNNFSQIYIAGKVAYAIRNSELFRIWFTKLKRIWLRCTDLNQCFLPISTAL